MLVTFAMKKKNRKNEDKSKKYVYSNAATWIKVFFRFLGNYDELKKKQK